MGKRAYFRPTEPPTVTTGPGPDAFVERCLSGFSPEQVDDVRVQAKAMGYSFARGDCTAITAEDEAGNARGVCVPSLAILQNRAISSGMYGGRVGPVEFRTVGGPWTDVWTDPVNPPYACRMSIRRKGIDEPQVFIGRWCELKEDNTFWDKRPTEALQRSVEVMALSSLFRDVVSDPTWPEEVPL